MTTASHAFLAAVDAIQVGTTAAAAANTAVVVAAASALQPLGLRAASGC
jgi:hypothetical protein